MERACASVERELLVSTGEEIMVLSADGTLHSRAPLEGAGALCAGDGSLFCAGCGGVIWRMDRQTLMPQMICGGGPGVCDLLVSKDGKRLYALLGDADSVLLSDARSGQALALNRCGCNPRNLALRADTLAVSGGESGCVHLFDAGTLESRGEISMPGPVCSMAFCGELLCALCLTPDLNAMLVAWKKGISRSLRLKGMPGCLYLLGNSVLAAVHGGLYVFECRSWKLLAKHFVPGRASRICVQERRILLYDPLSERVLSSESGAPWQVLCGGAKAMNLA